MLSQRYGFSPLMVLTSMSTHWNLIRQLTKREILSRYRRLPARSPMGFPAPNGHVDGLYDRVQGRIWNALGERG